MDKLVTKSGDSMDGVLWICCRKIREFSSNGFCFSQKFEMRSAAKRGKGSVF